jgi:hypothetical protein
MVIRLIAISSIWRKSGEMNQNEQVKIDAGINISQKHKTFLWIWGKCGTTHMKEILKGFDFKYYTLENNTLVLRNTNIVQDHSCNVFPGHENYKLLAAIRNPYAKFFSEFIFTNKTEKIEHSQKNKERYLKDLESRLNQRLRFMDNCCDFFDREPDYPVRLENLFEDYSKIPFIIESDYYKSGRLEEKTKVKVNVSNEDENSWKKFYTQQTADMVYYRMPRYFELFGYDKNSWLQ